MKIGSNDSMAFTGIRVNTSRMCYDQMGLADKLETAISLLKGKDAIYEKCVDVYVVPGQRVIDAYSDQNIVVKFIDLLSGNYLREKEGKIIKYELKRDCIKAYDKLAAKILDTIERVSKGEIERPKVSYTKLMNGKTTDMAKLDPERAESLAKEFRTDTKYYESLMGKQVAKVFAHESIFDKYLSKGSSEF